MLTCVDECLKGRLDLHLIRSFAPFKTMAEHELDGILRFAQIRRIEPNGSYFRQGDVAQHFFFLIQGRLKVTQVTPEGRQVLLRIVHPGDLFGVARVLERPDYPGTATAAVQSMALTWDSSQWDHITERHPTLAMSALHAVARHVQELHARIGELSTADVERRIANALLRLAATAGRSTGSGILIDFPITRQDIAEMTGTTLHTVSRILCLWAERGIIESSRLRVVVRSPDQLLSVAHG
jgi:CRP-like cAMP-binding protein